MLELKDATYFYKSQKDKVVLDKISYRFEKGKITVSGKELQKSSLNLHRKNNVSLIFQNYNLIDYLTPVENVKLGEQGPHSVS